MRSSAILVLCLTFLAASALSLAAEPATPPAPAAGSPPPAAAAPVAAPASTAAPKAPEPVRPRGLMAEGKSIWENLKAADYQKTYVLWPNTSALRGGKSPHGAYVSVFVNRDALDCINGRQGAFRPGSLVVKENYTKDKKLDSVTVMFKARSYNPKAGDWFWAKYDAAGLVSLEGRVKPCIDCHVARNDNDYTFSGPLK